MLDALGRLGARLFGGGHGRPVPASEVAPREERLDCGAVHLAALRWPLPDGAPAAPPLVLLHGLNDTAWSWARVAGALATERTVVALTLRGHGRSDRPESGYAIDDAARDVVAALARLAPAGCDLAGHSWGGRVAIHVAASAPDRVRRLVLADPVLPAGLNPFLRRFPGLIDAAYRSERAVHPDRESLDAAGKRRAYLVFGDELDVRVWRAKHEQRPDGTWAPLLPDPAFRAILRALHENDADRLDAVRCPTLLLRPTFTVSFWPGELRPFRRRPGWTVRRIAGDHSFIQSNPADTIEALRAFTDPDGAHEPAAPPARAGRGG